MMKKKSLVLVALATISIADLSADGGKPFTSSYSGAVNVVEANWLQTPAQCLKNPICRTMLLKNLREVAQQLRRAGEVLTDNAIDFADEVWTSICSEKDKPKAEIDAP